ncbi:MAG: alpha/beta hydrolase, partial [Alphaproteobacteria bacterium]|nr:alpha/beta hydrolase [Alphaproteobacteria bacterium]
FSFGGAISTYLAGRLKQRVSHLALKSPAGLPPQPDGIRNRMSYKAARGDEAAMRTAIRFNLLQNMLFYPDSLDEEAMTIQRYCVDNTRFDSRKISGGGSLFDNLKKVTCPVMVLWGEKDDFDFRPADPMIADMLAAKSDIEVHRIPKAGHWSAYENAPVVNRHLIDFMTSER